MNSQPAPSSPRQLVFGPFAFDEIAGDLRKHGVRVRIQGQPLRILEALIGQPGRTITRDEFRQQLWTNTIFVDFEHGLNAAMNRLRLALGDSADQPRYIETLPGRGYRFIAPVQQAFPKPVLVMTAAGLPEVEPAVHVEPAIGSGARKAGRNWIIGAGVIVGLAGGYVLSNRPQSGAGAITFRSSISPPNGFSLEAGSSRQTFAMSPDGAHLAFTAMDESGVGRVFVRDLDATESREFPNSIGSYHVFWAPDSRSLFTTNRGSLRRSALDSDSYQVICDTPPIMLTGELLGADLLISGRSANFVVPASGGTPRAIKEMYPWPQLLPDGVHLLYTVLDSKSGHHRARVVKYGEPLTIIDLLETDSRAAYAPSILKPGTGYLFYVRAGNILAQPFDPRSLRIQGPPIAVVSRTYSFFPTGSADFSVSHNGTLAYRRYQSRSQLAWVNRQGRVLNLIGPANVNLKQGRLSPDGRKIAAPIFNVERGVNEMWIIDAQTGDARRAIAGRGLVDSPVWSPDSGRLVFSRAYDGPPKLFLRGIGEMDPEETLPHEYYQLATDWSRDGRFIAITNTAFSINSEMSGDVWLIDMARERKLVHLIDTPFHEGNPAFSPDGRWLAFTSNESGRTEVYVQAFDAGESPRLTGERHLVSRHGAICLRWARDGKELFYLAWDGRVYAVPITLSPQLKIAEPVPLFAIGIEARAAMHTLAGFDVSADGQRLLVPVIQTSEKSEIVVIQNWEASLKLSREKLN